MTIFSSLIHRCTASESGCLGLFWTRYVGGLGEKNILSTGAAQRVTILVIYLKLIDKTNLNNET